MRPGERFLGSLHRGLGRTLIDVSLLNRHVDEDIDPLLCDFHETLPDGKVMRLAVFNHDEFARA
jgi:hypothetical protein